MALSAMLAMLEQEWFLALLLECMSARDFSAVSCCARRRCSIARRAWLQLAKRDFPDVQWPQLLATVSYPRPGTVTFVLNFFCGPPKKI